MTSKSDYSRITIGLHWAVAAVILAMLLTALQAWQSQSEAASLYWLTLHGSIGTLFTILIAIRIILHFRTRQPAALAGEIWERRLSFSVHKLMLVLVAAQLVTGPVDIWSGGWPIQVFGWFEIPPPFAKWGDASHDLIGSVHRWTGVAMFSLIVLHILGAVKHHFIDGDRTLKRMLGL